MRLWDLPVKRIMSLAILIGCAALSNAAHADALDQGNHVMFGLMGSYIPHQNNLPADISAFGHYVSFTHDLDFFYTGLRLAFLYGWLPSGATGQQYLIDPDLFVGVRLEAAKRVTLRLEVGTGPLFNGGEGFPFAIVDHSYLRGLFQWKVVKSVTVEAFAGPSFLLGSSVVGTFVEMGLGCGWSF
jgi:hypothetical protein